MSDQSLFNDVVLTGPFTDGLVASELIGNNNEDKAVRVFIKYKNFSPNPTSDRLTAVIEKETLPGLWEALGAQHEPISSDDNAPNRHIIVSPLFNANPGVDEFVDVDGGIRISRSEGVAGKSMRLALYKTTNGSGAHLQSFKIDATASTYNT